MKIQLRFIPFYLTLLALVASLLGGALTVTPARAASLTAGTASELIAAINTSNSNGQDDTITLTNDIVLTEVNVDFGGGNGLPLIDADGGKSLTIDGAGYSISRSSAGGTPVFRLLYITAGAVVTLQNLTFLNGSNGSSGGAILNAGTLTVKNSSFLSNTAGGGGAIHNYLYAVLNIQDSVFTGNSTTSLSGGAIYSTGNSVIISGSTFTGNTTAQNGGAISMNGGDTLSITNSTFVNNTATSFGGGVYNSANYDVEIISATFFNNAAADGGAVYNESGSVTLKNSLLAVDLFGMVNCGGSVSITAGVDNIATDTTCASSTAVSFNQLKIGTLGSHGRSTQTIPLLAGSPAIDHASADEASCPDEDQRGVTRDSSCDIGAFESQAQKGPTFIVNTGADTNDNSCDVLGSGIGNQDCTLREAINAANADADDSEITFADDYIITSAALGLTSNITITGNGLANTVIQASDCNPVTLPGGCTPAGSRIFTIQSGSATLNDITVRYGDCSSCVTGGTNGGGIWVSNTATLTINNSNVSDNKSVSGGGIWNGGTLTINNSTLSGNYASQQGGALNNSGTLTITASTFNGNTAATNGGGAIYSDASFDVSYEVVVSNSTFYENTATGSAGGGMRVHGIAPLTLRNNTFSHNSGPNAGGAIYLGEVKSYLYNNIFANSVSGLDCVADGSTEIMAHINNLMETSSTSCGTPAYTFDPNLDGLADNGGATQTMALLSGSQAIDTGDTATCASADQRGVTRPQGAACDIGAYEFVFATQNGPNFIVNANADTDDGYCDVLEQGTGNQDCTLREAINAANANNDASIITFADDYIITLDGSQLPDITEPLTITGIGPTSADTIIQASTCDPVNLPDGCTPSVNRVFLVSSTGNLTLDMLTVRYGYCDGTCPSDHGVGGIGGGILNNGILTVTNSTISNNKTNFSAGGIYSLGSSSLTINKSTIANNSTGSQGGGMWVAKGIITNSTIVGNTGTFYGQGIFKQPAFPGGDQWLTITNSTISGNNIHNNGSGISIANSIIHNSNCTSTPIFDAGNNLDSGNACGFTANALTNTDPLLDMLADNGGPTQTMALLPGSPAINAGTNTGCPAEDQRGVARDSACDIGAYEYESAIEPGSLTVKSNAKQDGWVLESSETSNKGGTKNNASTTLRLGDDALNRQYRSILSFNTSAIPDGANITSVTLFVKRAGSSGGNLFKTFQGLMVDVRKGNFGTGALQLADFKGSAVGTYGPFQPILLLDGWFTGWYAIDLTPAAAHINDAGNTQLRLRFKLDDNNNFTANFLSLYSGNAGAANRPQLIVEYGNP